VVLDNFETPWTADPLPTEELLRMLAAIPGVGLAVSARGTGRPAGLRWADFAMVSPLPLAEARRLFLNVAGPGPGDDPGLDALSHLCGRLRRLGRGQRIACGSCRGGFHPAVRLVKRAHRYQESIVQVAGTELHHLIGPPADLLSHLRHQVVQATPRPRIRRRPLRFTISPRRHRRILRGSDVIRFWPVRAEQPQIVTQLAPRRSLFGRPHRCLATRQHYDEKTAFPAPTPTANAKAA